MIVKKLIKPISKYGLANVNLSEYAKLNDSNQDIILSELYANSIYTDVAVFYNENKEPKIGFVYQNDNLEILNYPNESYTPTSNDSLINKSYVDNKISNNLTNAIKLDKGTYNLNDYYGKSGVWEFITTASTISNLPSSIMNSACLLINYNFNNDCDIQNLIARDDASQIYWRKRNKSWGSWYKVNMQDIDLSNYAKLNSNNDFSGYNVFKQLAISGNQNDLGKLIFSPPSPYYEIYMEYNSPNTRNNDICLDLYIDRTGNDNYNYKQSDFAIMRHKDVVDYVANNSPQPDLSNVAKLNESNTFSQQNTFTNGVRIQLSDLTFVNDNTAHLSFSNNENLVFSYICDNSNLVDGSLIQYKHLKDYVSQTTDIKKGWNIGLTGLVKTNKTYGDKPIYEGILTSPLLSGGDTNFISGSNLTLLECNLLESSDGNIFYPVDIKQYNLRYYNSYNWRFTANANKYYRIYIKAM